MAADTPPVTLADVEAAARRIDGEVVRTPTLHSRTLSEITGAQIWVKFENFQFTASFKERGALNKLKLMAPGNRARGVVTASAGNHAQALAYHAARLGVPATVVMPVATPAVKAVQTEAHGARVVLHGGVFDESHAEASRIAEAEELTFVHPFNDPAVIAGQGTAALEMLADAPELEALVVPIGGGGLISGMATAAKALRPRIEVVGVQAELYPSMYAEVAGRSMPGAGDTIAEGIAVKKPDPYTAGIVRRLVDDILLVSEDRIEAALSLYAQIEKTVAEGAGAAALAALLAHPERLRGRKVGIVLSGGNIDPRLLATVLLRDLARERRLARLHLALPDRPGALAEIVRLFETHRVSIVDMRHERVFTALPAKAACVEIDCEARDADDLDALSAALGHAGYGAGRVEIR